MPHTINQNSSTLNNSLSVPSDGIDPVNETSVDPVFQNLLNNTYYLAYTHISNRPHLTANSFNGTSITLLPFSPLWVSTNNVAIATANWVAVSKSTNTTLTNANLDIPGAFTGNTAYWIYAYAVGSPATPAFEISVTQPDSTLTFKGTDITRRYIGSFITNSTPAIVSYEMIDREYFLKTSNAVSSGPVSAGGGGTDFTLSSTTDYHYPATAKILKLTSRITNTGATVGGGTLIVTYSPPIAGPDVQFVTDFLYTTPISTTNTVQLEAVVVTASVNLNIKSDGTTNVTVLTFANGYKE